MCIIIGGVATMNEGSTIPELTDEGFEDFLKERDLVIVDFWGPACAPCKMIAPVLEQLASEMRDKVTFAKMDVTKNMKTSMELGIRSIPTLAFYREGKLVKMKAGFMPKPRLIAEIREIS